MQQIHFVNDTEYTQNCVIARVYAKRILDKARVDRMIDAPNAKEAFNLLLESDYAESAQGVEDVYDYDTLLGNEIKRIYALSQELFLDKKIVHLHALKYEYHNLRVIAKELVTDENFEDLYIDVCSFDPQFVKEQVKAGSYMYVPDYVEEALKEAVEEYGKTKNPQTIDFTMDQAYFDHQERLAEEIDVPLISIYVKAEIDFYNVISLLRAQKHKVATLQVLDSLMVEGGDIEMRKLKELVNSPVERLIDLLKFYGRKGKFMIEGIEHYRATNSLEVLEDKQVDYLSEISAETRYQHFGPEPIFAYILEKQKELAMVRIIIISKLNKVPPVEIRERLGAPYV